VRAERLKKVLNSSYSVDPSDLGIIACIKISLLKNISSSLEAGNRHKNFFQEILGNRVKLRHAASCTVRCLS